MWIILHLDINFNAAIFGIGTFELTWINDLALLILRHNQAIYLKLCQRRLFCFLRFDFFLRLSGVPARWLTLV